MELQALHRVACSFSIEGAVYYKEESNEYDALTVPISFPIVEHLTVFLFDFFVRSSWHKTALYSHFAPGLTLSYMSLAFYKLILTFYL